MQAYSTRSGSQVPPEKMEGPRYLYELREGSFQSSTSFWLPLESLGLRQQNSDLSFFPPTAFLCA